MLLWKTDPTNQLDILSLLKYNKSAIPFIDLEKVNRQRVGGAHPHITHFFSPDMAQVIADNFHDLQQQLELWIGGKKVLR